MSPVVTGKWLQAQLGSPDLVVLDATWFLNPQQLSARRRFTEAHIPGAQFFDIDHVCDAGSPLPHMAPGSAQFELFARELGISNDSRVVFYDQQGLFSAARGWWLFKLFGHENVYLLDGGLPKWRDAGCPLEDGASPKFQATGDVEYRARINPQRVRKIDDMLDNLVTRSEQVLDARSLDRFSGKVPEPRAGVASGHIPGSVSLPYTDVLNDDGTFRLVGEIRRLLAARGVDSSSKVVTSCGTGVTAAVIALAVEVAGYAPVGLYDGSWTEWGSRSDTPKVALEQS
ncbi:thiosulfate/3-mercaptopyruvate sulfurtransferase [Paraburkholderia fungorum]|uniref:Sulfurtransferase n=1 Tax=Paraburkholderia fungorum TaxID=134537 RepID=A0A1H1JZM6_9BURK|nr:3-mercaptopyruvate sulfurtransferase [Paraburkholderia fungorum]SDR55414.1 thiosulfate/3-mercaptopyruvate sulfurtransferase [Paraburkholderia fungorum]